MRIPRLIALVVLALWVLLGPTAMAFDGCLAMGAACEAPCGTSAGAFLSPARSMVPDLIAFLGAQPDQRLPTRPLAVFEPPPKPPRPAA